jgi:YfiH family protein
MQLSPPFREWEGQVALELAGAHAVFTTRSWGDARATQAELAARLGVCLARPQQVHGSAVLVVSDPQQAAGAQADAVITTTPGVAATVLTADCLPIVISNGGAVAAVHAGWRGLAGGVLANTVAALRRLGGGVISAAIGPGAGACCYEVGEELHRRFNARSQDFRVGRKLDLKAIARVQLMEAGVARVHDCGICTICAEPPVVFSHRREGPETGRGAAIAWLS